MLRAVDITEFKVAYSTTNARPVQKICLAVEYFGFSDVESSKTFGLFRAA